MKPIRMIKEARTMLLLVAVLGLSFFTGACSNGGSNGKRASSSSRSRDAGAGSRYYSDVFRTGLGENRDGQLALTFFSDSEDSKSNSITAEGTLDLGLDTKWGDCNILEGSYDVVTESSGYRDGVGTIRDIKATGRSGGNDIEFVIKWAMFTSTSGGQLLSCDNDKFSYAMAAEIWVTRSDDKDCKALRSVPKIYLFSLTNNSLVYKCGN